MEVAEASSCAPSTVTNDPKLRKKNKVSEPDSSKSPKRKYNILTDSAFLISKVMRLILEPSSETDLYRDDSLTS